MNKTVETLAEAHNYIEGLLRAGVPFQESRIHADRFKKEPRNRLFLLLGVKKSAERFCKSLEPNGKWNVEINPKGTPYERAGIFGPVAKATQAHEASVWYNRYLPYAVAMMKAEHCGPPIGINFESINSYYGTCMGFLYMTHEPNRFVEEDVKLYQELYDASSEIGNINLPFDEMYRPACAYVALHKPKLLKEVTTQDSRTMRLVHQMIEIIKRPQPKIKW